MTPIRRWLHRCVGRVRSRDERGSVAPFVVITSVGLLLLAGLVIDGGRQLNAKGIAIAYAQEAARAGAQAVDVADPALGLVDSAAVSAATEYCRQAQASDGTLVRCVPTVRTVVVNGNPQSAVEVETEVSRSAILLAMIGRQTLQATGIAQARPVSGIEGADDAKLNTLEPPSVAPPGGDDDDVPVSTWTPPAPTEIEECIPADEVEDDEPGGPDDPEGPGNPDDPNPDNPGPDNPGPDNPGPDDPRPGNPDNPDNPEGPGGPDDDEDEPDLPVCPPAKDER